jgi:hypothetical protein
MDLPRYAIAVPFPATGLFRRLKAENRILTQDWSLCDGQHVVFEPKNMSPDELLRRTGRAWKKTYQYKSIARRVLGSGARMMVSGAANLGFVASPVLAADHQGKRSSSRSVERCSRPQR